MLAVTAALIHQAPARATADTGGPVTTTVAIDGTEMAATVDPAETGLNDIHLYFTTASGGGSAGRLTSTPSRSRRARPACRRGVCP